MEKYSCLTVEKRGHAAFVTMCAEPVNALTTQLVDELYDAFASLGEDNDIWAVVLQSGKKLFAAGADLKELIAVGYDGNMATSQHMQRTFLAIEQFPHPVICAVNGVAFGGGLELALSCDLRVFDSSTKVALPECGLGILPGAGGTQRLARLIGAGAAKRLVFTGEVIRAAEAYRLGICEYYAEDCTCTELAAKIAETICTKAPLAVMQSKKCIDYASSHSLEEELDYERKLGSELFETYDKNEGIGAFLEKRTPEFKNK